MQTAVIAGIGGLQQAAIAQAFRAAGWTVRGTSRNPGPGIATADPETGRGLTEAFQDADVVVMTLPQDHRPGAGLRIAQAVSKAAAEAGVGRIVLNMAARIVEDSPYGIYVAMRAALDAVASGQVPAVVLQPTVYMDNLIAPWTLPAILEGTVAYPAPSEAGIAWISHRTLAEAAVAAATRDVAGQSLLIGGPEALSGDALAVALGLHLGRPVAYARIPIDGFAAGLNASFGAPAGDRIAELYRDLETHPDRMADGGDGLARLGVTPEPFGAFIARQRWSLAA